LQVLSNTNKKREDKDNSIRSRLFDELPFDIFNKIEVFDGKVFHSDEPHRGMTVKDFIWWYKEKSRIQNVPVILTSPPPEPIPEDATYIEWDKFLEEDTTPSPVHPLPDIIDHQKIQLEETLRVVEQDSIWKPNWSSKKMTIMDSTPFNKELFKYALRPFVKYLLMDSPARSGKTVGEWIGMITDIYHHGGCSLLISCNNSSSLNDTILDTFQKLKMITGCTIPVFTVNDFNKPTVINYIKSGQRCIIVLLLNTTQINKFAALEVNPTSIWFDEVHNKITDIDHDKKKSIENLRDIVSKASFLFQFL
jgi:hypothetical protein